MLQIPLLDEFRTAYGQIDRLRVGAAIALETGIPEILASGFANAAWESAEDLVPVIDRVVAVVRQGVSSPYLEKRIEDRRRWLTRLISDLARARQALAEQTIDAPIERDLEEAEAALKALIETHEELHREPA